MRECAMKHPTRSATNLCVDTTINVSTSLWLTSSYCIRRRDQHTHAHEIMCVFLQTFRMSASQTSDMDLCPHIISISITQNTQTLKHTHMVLLFACLCRLVSSNITSVHNNEHAHRNADRHYTNAILSTSYTILYTINKSDVPTILAAPTSQPSCSVCGTDFRGDQSVSAESTISSDALFATQTHYASSALQPALPHRYGLLPNHLRQRRSSCSLQS